MPTALVAQLERARNELLDLTARNRLLNTPLARGRSTRLDIVDELGSEVFRILVQERREMSFLPALKPDKKEPAGHRDRADGSLSEGDPPIEDIDNADDELHFAQPEEPVEGSADRQTDRKLQTPLEDDKLQSRLLRLFYDARSLFEEQGVNSLYLALGFLEWYESPTSDKTRFAPLLLIPVELHRRTVNARFRLKVLEDEITTNLSLQARIKQDFGLQLPEVPDIEELDPGAYFSAVQEMIADQPRWKVHPDRMTLWFFSFARFLMFRDLDPEIWPEGKRPTDHPLVGGLLGEPVVFEPPLIGEDEPLDVRLDPRTICHIDDCDGSQAAAIAEVRGGRNLVIQGPPGTGKSQSITNAIAAAVRDGKTVLFVAEKLAALEVVKSRLDRVGLGDVCLELHSHKANRRSVLDDLGKTLNLGRPAHRDVERQAAELTRTRDRLNRYVAELHARIEPCGRTPYDLIGTLCRLQANGIAAFPCDVPDIADWSPATLREKQALLQDIVEHLAETGAPHEHVWRGVGRTTPLLPSELAALQQQLATLHDNLREILSQGTRLAGLLHIAWTPDEESFQSVQRLAQFAGKLRTIPEMDRAALADPAWEKRRVEITRAIERGRELARCREALSGVLAPVAWKTDVAQVRVDLAGTGRSLLRWFSGRWRRAIGTFRGIAESPGPKSLDDQLQALDQLMAGQACVADLGENGALDATGRSAFGSLWQGPDSDWNRLAAIADWEADCQTAGVPKLFRHVIARWTGTEATQTTYLALREVFRQAWDALRDVVALLEVDLVRTFGREKLVEIPLTDFIARLADWRGGTAELGRWIVLQRRLGDVDAAGFGPLRLQIEQGALDEQSLERLELMFCEAAMRRVLDQFDAIAGFDGVSQTRLVEEFRRLDKERIQLTRNEVAAAHYERLPSGGDMGEVGIIRGEIRKKRNHRALRRLLADAGHAVQAIKPVFMMSPVSVAQFLEPGALRFDLLVVDEASQVRPVEALGAVMRCRQAVVVGDNKQLPPTAFFDRVTSGDESDEQTEGTAAGDVESILDLCVARNFPQRMLRWHYRSKHHSLIAVSNREFYDNGLYVVPSPVWGGSGRGLELRFLKDGVFDRGRSRTNRREAQAVAQAMIDHARERPNLSLGVGTFSVSQRDLILDELELLRRAHPETEEFFAQTDDEPWFVKNLENIQGDERDAIFISVGYGRDESGFIAMNFGPLTAAGGERRLNVLISRAKQQCIVFSSIRADDVDLRRTSARGAAALKTFLQYAETGRLDVSKPTDRACDSEFEAQVADALRASGWQVDHQVGIAGFFIDLAVIDPDIPGRYLLGIECDGAMYHSARWARDRDRLRQAVLEDHGWTLHRIWSTDWFHSRAEQVRTLLEVLEDLRLLSRAKRLETTAESGPSAPAPESSPGEASQVSFPMEEDYAEIPREAADGEDDNGQVSLPYEEAQFTDPLMSREIHDLKAAELATIVKRIIAAEGPIHGEEVARRVTTLWGLQRAGSRIGKSVDRALAHALRKGLLDESAGFYATNGQQEFPVRNREHVASTTLRRPELLPPQELDAAIVAFVAAHISATPEETARAVARLLGFRSTSGQLRARIDERISFLVATTKLSVDRDVLRVVG